MLLIDHQPPRTSRTSRYTAFAIVVLLHLLLLALLALQRAGVFPPMLPPIEVQLIPGGGGGGQAAVTTDSPRPRAALPSSVHVPPKPEPYPDTLAAPPEPAPQELVPTLSPGTPDAAQSESSAISAGAHAGAGSGGGSGNGVGAGNGSGVGAGSGPGRGGDQLVLIRGPVGAVISQDVSPGRLAALPGSYAVLRCTVLPMGVVRNCRVIRESPAGAGVGRAAEARAEEFRFRPMRQLGRSRGQGVVRTFAIAFPPEPATPAEAR